MSQDYVYEKLSSSVRVLAISPGKIQERLRSAWSVFGRLTPEDFPPDRRHEFEKVIATLRKVPPESLSDEDACRLARAICDLDFEATESWYASIPRSLR